jgi:predicted transcriptional regulator
LVAEYETGALQTDLALKYGVTQNAVSKILTRCGAKLRTLNEIQPPTFDVDEAVRLYEVERRTTGEVAKVLGVSQSVVASHLYRRGVTKSSGRGHKYRFFDRDFFSDVNHVSAYWAGFIAADGCVHRENNTISFGLHPDDRVLLERLKIAAKLEQPVTERLNNKGKLYVWMDVTCPQWVEALEKNYLITPRKSLTLQPPIHLGWEFVWSFVRGVLDGDGHASVNGRKLQLTSGSKPFLEWVVLDVFRAHHKIYEHPQYERVDGSIGIAYGCYVSGSVLREILPRLYANSTPETRLDRKYDRFVAGGLLNSPV